MFKLYLTFKLLCEIKNNFFFNFASIKNKTLVYFCENIIILSKEVFFPLFWPVKISEWQNHQKLCRPYVSHSWTTFLTSESNIIGQLWQYYSKIVLKLNLKSNYQIKLSLSNTHSSTNPSYSLGLSQIEFQ